MESTPYYIVTSYGCDSTSSGMYMPKNKIFTNFDEAYCYFLSISPDLDSVDERAERYINNRFNKNAPHIESGKCLVIENRVQIGGYHEGTESSAKRPFGAIITLCTL